MIERIDHFVLTVQSLDATCEFYKRVLGFKRVDLGGRYGRACRRISGRDKGCHSGGTGTHQNTVDNRLDIATTRIVQIARQPFSREPGAPRLS